MHFDDIRSRGTGPLLGLIFLLILCARHQGVVIEQKDPSANKSIIDENMTSKYRLNVPTTTTAKGKGKVQQAPIPLPLRPTAKRLSSLSREQLQSTNTTPSGPSTYYRQHTMSISRMVISSFSVSPCSHVVVAHAPARSSQLGARGIYTSNPPGGHYQPSPHYRPHTLGAPSSSAPSSKATTPTPTTNSSSGNVIARQPPQLSFTSSHTAVSLSFPSSSSGSCSLLPSPIPVPVLFGDGSSSPSRSSEDTLSTDSNPDSDDCQIDGHDESGLTPWPEEVAAAVEAVLNMHSQRKHLSAGVADMNASDDGMPFIVDPEQAKMDLDEDIRRFPSFTMDHILMGDVSQLHPGVFLYLLSRCILL